MSRLAVLTLAALVGGSAGGCAHIPPPAEHSRYESLSDYIQRGYSPPEVKRFRFFTWEELEQQFNQLRVQFLQATGKVPGYNEAMKRVGGI